jgi:predicted RNase H-like HicB family nuclease
LETEQETDGHWLAEVPELAGLMAYGETRSGATARAEPLAFRLLAECLEHGEARPMPISFSIAAE